MQYLLLFGILYKTRKPRQYLSLQAREVRGDRQARLSPALEYKVL